MEILELRHQVVLTLAVTLGVTKDIAAMSSREVLAFLRRPAA